jgi:hypothetical protein
MACPSRSVEIGRGRVFDALSRCEALNHVERSVQTLDLIKSKPPKFMPSLNFRARAYVASDYAVGIAAPFVSSDKVELCKFWRFAVMAPLSKLRAPGTYARIWSLLPFIIPTVLSRFALT